MVQVAALASGEGLVVIISLTWPEHLQERQDRKPESGGGG